jgi:hypothetical protein
MGVSTERTGYKHPGLWFVLFTILGTACVWGSLRLVYSGYLLKLYEQARWAAYAGIGVPMIFVDGLVLGLWSIFLTEILGFRPRRLYHYEGWPHGRTISIRFRR